MTGWRGLFAGALALAGLEVVVSTSGASDRVAGAATGLAGLVARVLDPTVPAIGDHSKSAPAPAVVGGAYVAPPHPKTVPVPPALIA